MIRIIILYNDIHYLYICCMKYMANVAEPLFQTQHQTMKCREFAQQYFLHLTPKAAVRKLTM